MPTRQAGNANGKAFGGLFKGQSILLFDKKDMAAKINRIGHYISVIILKALGYSCLAWIFDLTKTR